VRTTVVVMALAVATLLGGTACSGSPEAGDPAASAAPTTAAADPQLPPGLVAKDDAPAIAPDAKVVRSGGLDVSGQMVAFLPVKLNGKWGVVAVVEAQPGTVYLLVAGLPSQDQVQACQRVLSAAEPKPGFGLPLVDDPGPKPSACQSI
jgi:hypothetical protein